MRPQAAAPLSVGRRTSSISGRAIHLTSGSAASCTSRAMEASPGPRRSAFPAPPESSTSRWTRPRGRPTPATSFSLERTSGSSARPMAGPRTTRFRSIPSSKGFSTSPVAGHEDWSFVKTSTGWLAFQAYWQVCTNCFENTVVYFSTDQGATWNTLPTPVTSAMACRAARRSRRRDRTTASSMRFPPTTTAAINWTSTSRPTADRISLRSG